MREALEQVYALDALDRLRAKGRGQRAAAAPADLESIDGERLPAAVGGGRGARVNNSAEAKKFADTPHLTGDPEWDALELSETDPSKPPLKIAKHEE